MENTDLHVPVPRDLSRVKEKILFGLTVRQLICFGAAVVLGVPIFFFIRSLGDVSLATLCMIVVMMPFFLLAMYTRHGQPLETILRHYLEVRWSRSADRSSEDIIVFDRVFPDGICRVKEGYYSQTIRFGDINYQLAQKEDKQEIMNAWCEFLNSFDASVHFQLSFYNQKGKEREVRLALKEDGYDDLRKEINHVLWRLMLQGDHGLQKEKYLTFGIEAPNVKAAIPRLARVSDRILEQLSRMGVDAEVLTGQERLRVMHTLFHLGVPEPFHFSWEELLATRRTVKGAIAPASFDFSEGTYFRMGNQYAAVSYLDIQAPTMSDQLLKKLRALKSAQALTLHVTPVDQGAAIKMAKRTLTELERSKIDEQKRAFRIGYDPDILPPDLEIYGSSAKEFLNDLMRRNEKLFHVTATLLQVGRTKEELEVHIQEAAALAQEHRCELWRADYEQEQGLMSSLPLADNQVELQRDLTSSSLGILIPFWTHELQQDSPDAFYYGVNALSGNPIFVDRKRLKNPNGLIIGTSGSGKSFAAKREILLVYLMTEDDVVICDPESEYSALVKRLQGQVIQISPHSKQYINPLDITGDYGEKGDPIKLKASFIHLLFELILGRKMNGGEKSVLDRCIYQIYRDYFEDPRPERMPILLDLYLALLEQHDKDARRVAKSLEIYVKGSMNVFNHRTNVDIHNRLVCYDIRELGSQLKEIGMFIVQDQIWGRITSNRRQGKFTRYFVDEFHLLLREEQTAAYSIEIFKRFRKWGGIPTGVTQDIKDLLASREISNIFENCEFIYMLNQRGEDREILAKYLHISPHQLSFVTRAAEGEGLLFFGNVILPFKDRFPKETELYRLMTTKLSEVENGGFR